MTRRPPRSTRTDTLFPDTTLFRSPFVHLRERLDRGKLARGQEGSLPAALVLNFRLPRHAAGEHAEKLGFDGHRSRFRLFSEPRRQDRVGGTRPAVPVALHIVGHGPQPRRLFARHLRFMCAPWLAARRFVMGARPLIVTIRLPPQSIDAPRGRLIVVYIGDRREFPGAVIDQPPPWLRDQLPAVAV